MDALKRFAQSLAAIHGAGTPGVAGTNAKDNVNIRRAELLARAEAFLGKDYDVAKLAQIEHLQLQFAQQQTALYKNYTQGRISAKDYAANVNALIANAFLKVEKSLGKRDFIKLLGAPRERLCGPVDVGVFEPAQHDAHTQGEKSAEGRTAHEDHRQHFRRSVPATVTLKSMAASLAEQNDMSKKRMNKLLEGFVSVLTKRLRKGEKIHVNGLGVFVVAKRTFRVGRNPATGEVLKIKASKKVSFRPAKNLKEAI